MQGSSEISRSGDETRLGLEGMQLSDRLSKAFAATADRSSEPLQMIWPVAGNPVGMVAFSTFDQWHSFILQLSLRRIVPDIVRLKFERALRLHLLAWLDFDLIKAGELVALTALELALTDRYGDKVRDKQGKIYFHRLLAYMPKHDGLTDAQMPIVQLSGGTGVGFLTGKARPTLAEIRNKLAHGDPFDGFPYAGLLSLVCDLIDYAYRDWPEVTRKGPF
jgi:hypothetical protein